MRRYYLDNIRWTIVLLVMLFHVIAYFIIYDPTAGMEHSLRLESALLYALYPWLMPMMFMVAGISSRLAIEKKGEKSFILDRMWKLLIPGIVGCMLLHWIAGYYYVEAETLLWGTDRLEGKTLFEQYWLCVWEGRGVLWFIQLLMVFSLTLLGIRKIEKDRLYNWVGKHIPHAVVTIVGGFLLVWLAELGLSDSAPYWLVQYRPVGYGMWFLLGYYVFSHEETIEKLIPVRRILIISALLGVELVIATTMGSNFFDSIYLKKWTFSLSGWLTTLSVLVVYKQWGNRTNKVTQYMSKSSFGWYVIQNFLFAIGGYCIIKYMPLPMWGNYLCMGVLLFLGCPVLYELIRRIPILRTVLCGII